MRFVSISFLVFFLVPFSTWNSFKREMKASKSERGKMKNEKISELVKTLKFSIKWYITFHRGLSKDMWCNLLRFFLVHNLDLQSKMQINSNCLKSIFKEKSTLLTNVWFHFNKIIGRRKIQWGWICDNFLYYHFIATTNVSTLVSNDTQNQQIRSNLWPEFPFQNIPDVDKFYFGKNFTLAQDSLLLSTHHNYVDVM